MTAKQEREIVEWTQDRRTIAYASRILYPNLDPHDAIQDAVEHAYKRLPADHPSAAKWLTCDLKFTCLHYMRRERRAKNFSDGDGHHNSEQPTPLYPPPDLTPGERKALGARAMGYSYIEIEKMYDWTQTKVKRCLYEGRTKLREALEA